MNICIIGTGYVGLVTGASLAYLGNKVVCVDIDEGKIDKLSRGISPIYEPGLDELLNTETVSRNLSFTTDLETGATDAEVIFIAVGTPSSAEGTPDLSYVKAAAREIGRTIVSSRNKDLFRIIINKSTVPIGSGNWVEMLVREEIRSLLPASTNGNDTGHLKNSLEEICRTFTVVSNPEFLREGSALKDTFYPDRIVVGASNGKGFEVLRHIYLPILEQSFLPPDSIAPRPAALECVPLVTTDLTSAEMIKYAANSFLAMKISFANEMANICEKTGADIKQVAEGIGLDQRINPRFLNAGVGWGGSCFGKDVSALIEIAREYGYEPQLLAAARSINSRQRQLVIQKLQSALRIVKGRTIGLLGLAFKPDTDDVRDAPSFDIASALVRMGAYVKVYDPIAMEGFRNQHQALDVAYATSIQNLAADCDALVVVTEWDDFRKLDLNEIFHLMSDSIIVDGRNIFDPERASAIGFKYMSIGRDVSSSNKKAARKAYIS